MEPRREKVCAQKRVTPALPNGFSGRALLRYRAARASYGHNPVHCSALAGEDGPAVKSPGGPLTVGAAAGLTGLRFVTYNASVDFNY